MSKLEPRAKAWRTSAHAARNRYHRAVTNMVALEIAA